MSEEEPNMQDISKKRSNSMNKSVSKRSKSVPVPKSSGSNPDLRSTLGLIPHDLLAYQKQFRTKYALDSVSMLQLMDIGISTAALKLDDIDARVEIDPADCEQITTKLRQLRDDDGFRSQIISRFMKQKSAKHPAKKVTGSLSMDVDDPSEREAMSSPQNYKFYRHQVAGHFPMLWSTKGRVFKPLHKAEYEFYRDLDKKFPALKPFLPEFFGVMDSLDIYDIHQHESKKESNKRSWSIKCATKKLPEMESRQYLILEDLTYKYAQPSVLDLKLGRIQHSRNESAAKIKSKTTKALSTTSASLGLRLCGLQAYRPRANDFYILDKYHGRDLSSTQFRSMLRSFFHDGVSFRSDVLPYFIERLKALKAVFLSKSNFLLRSSSLLFVFEGDMAQSLKSPHMDLRLIDFAHVDIEPNKEVDTETLFGVNMLIELLEDMMHHRSQAEGHTRSRSDTDLLNGRLLKRRQSVPAQQYDDSVPMTNFINRARAALNTD